MRVAILSLLIAVGPAFGSPDEQCLSVEALQEMTCTTPPPPGTGLRADGRGAIHLPKPGFYRFIGGIVNSTTGPRWYTGGSYGTVVKTSSSPLEWIQPDGKREPVPTVYLYPPF